MALYTNHCVCVFVCVCVCVCMQACETELFQLHIQLQLVYKQGYPGLLYFLPYLAVFCTVIYSNMNSSHLTTYKPVSLTPIPYYLLQNYLL